MARRTGRRRRGRRRESPLLFGETREASKAAAGAHRRDSHDSTGALRLDEGILEVSCSFMETA